MLAAGLHAADPGPLVRAALRLHGRRLIADGDAYPIGRGRVLVLAACGGDHDERRGLAAREIEHPAENVRPHLAAAHDDERTAFGSFHDRLCGHGG